MENLVIVMKSLDGCTVGTGCNNCPYDGDGYCKDRLMRDALALLKELDGKYRAAVEMAAIATERAAARADGDLISRSELLKFPIRRDHYDRENGNPHFINGIETVMEYVETLPAVDAEPIVHAHWDGDCCSWCGELAEENNPRCPYCGAHMDEEVAE